MIILDNFSGVGCVKNATKDMGHLVISADIVKRDHIDIVGDILDFNPEEFSFIPHVLWFSPPCEKFSCKTNMKGGGNMYFQTIKDKKKNRVIGIKIRQDFNCDKRLKNKDPKKVQTLAKLHIQYVDKCFEIINYYKKLNKDLIWFIENPATGNMKHVIKDRAPFHNYCTYCAYGFDYMKPTHIFSNIKLNLKSCKRRPNGYTGEWCHKDNFSKRWDHKKQKFVMKPKTYNERSLVPESLIKDVISQAEKHLYKNLNPILQQ